MLNTNPSRKKDAWKYFVALPALVAFFLIFQVETIAQVKNSSVEANKDVSIVEMTIDKTSTDDEIKKDVDYFKDALGITVKVKNDTLIQKGIEKLEKLGIDRIITEKYVREK